MERPLEVVANTNPAIAPKGESPLARLQKKMRVWCLTVSTPALQAGSTDSISVARSKILRCRQVGKARDFDSRKSLPVRPLVRVQPPQPYGEVILMVRKQFAKLLVAGNGV